MNINTPLLSVEEMEALRADLQQPKSREAEPVDLASGDHALRRVVPIIERRLELFRVQSNSSLHGVSVRR